MKKHLIFFTVLTIASVIFSGCATPSYQNSYVDPVFDQIDREDVQYRTYVNNQLGSQTITQDQANFLLERNGQMIQYRKLKRQVDLNDPAMAVYLENEESYISKMQEALEKGEISKAEYDQKVQETKFRIAQFGQQRQLGKHQHPQRTIKGINLAATINRGYRARKKNFIRRA